MAINAKELYTKLENERAYYLRRARDSALLTIPSLMTEEHFANAAQVLPDPYQSVGARGLNNLSAALLLSLIPPNTPFFRLVLDPEAEAEFRGIPNIKTEIDQALGTAERTILKEIEIQQYRPSLSEAIKQLIVTGNVLLHFPEDGGIRVIKLDRYVLQRDPMGRLLKVITKESIATVLLPEEVQQQIGQTPRS